MDKLCGKLVVARLTGKRSAITDPWVKRALCDSTGIPAQEWDADVDYDRWLYVIKLLRFGFQCRV